MINCVEHVYGIKSLNDIKESAQRYRKMLNKCKQVWRIFNKFMRIVLQIVKTDSGYVCVLCLCQKKRWEVNS